MPDTLSHQAVMLQPALLALNIHPQRVYLDATFGRGGHAAAILNALNPQGRLFALDRDPKAVLFAEQQFANDARFSIRHGSFADLGRFCQDWGIHGQVNGLLLDLGVSSPQLDDAQRGFSFQQPGPLDMRMDNSQGISAAQWLQRATERDIADVLWQYGEERYARRIAKRIVAERRDHPIETTQQLVDIIIAASPRVERHKHPATRSFMALRIVINQELDALQSVLQQSLSILAKGGRLAVISFHSIEDRLVKRFLREQAKGRELPPGLPVMASATERTLRIVGKAIKPSAAEITQNPRARSAVLRVAERL